MVHMTTVENKTNEMGFWTMLYNDCTRFSRNNVDSYFGLSIDPQYHKPYHW